nr:unnamed protein product [Callosobruchus analis]
MSSGNSRDFQIPKQEAAGGGVGAGVLLCLTEVINKLQIRRIFEDGTEKPVRIWPSLQAYSKQIAGN